MLRGKYALMGSFTQKPAPKVPAAKQAGTASEEFNSLKHQLSGVASWEMTPTGWKEIQIIYTSVGTEAQARSFIKAIELPTPEM